MHRLAAVPALALTTALTTTPATAPVATAAPTAVTYYVDSAAGNDANAGTTSGTAWRSLAKVNGFAFQPGDRIAFKRGGSWTGSLVLSRSGTAASPIVVEAYGSGNLPKVGVSIVDGSDGNTVRWSTIKDNNKMSKLTPKEVNPDDDSGAFGFLIHGNDNVISRNVISGSFAFSYDYDWDGAAVEIFNGNRNLIEYNTTVDNETFTELGRYGTGKTADDNVFAYNSVTSTKVQGAFLVTRGAQSDIGPVRGTVRSTTRSTSRPPTVTAGAATRGAARTSSSCAAM